MDSGIYDRIWQEVHENAVVLYMKGRATLPQCGYSAAVVCVLDNLGIKYHDVDVLADPDLRQGVKEFSNWPTYPQLYIKGELVGGCDIVREMYAAGTLQDMLRQRGLLE